MLSIDDQREESEPAWAGADPPRFDLVCSGVLYTDVPNPTLLELLRESEICGVVAAMGPALFYARSDGPFVPYDRTLVDQNEERKVRDREFPWCWGDVLWVVARWQGMSLSVRVSKLEDAGDVFSALRVSDAEMADAVAKRSRAAAGKAIAQVRLPLFLEGLRLYRRPSPTVED